MWRHFEIMLFKRQSGDCKPEMEMQLHLGPIRSQPPTHLGHGEVASETQFPQL